MRKDFYFYIQCYTIEETILNFGGTRLMEWKNLYRGFLMGISDLVPGVSGGTIAFILGIYERFLESISGFFSKDWKKHVPFLLPLVLGIGSALLIFSRIFDFLLTNYREPTYYFFIGLVLGIIPFVAKQANVKTMFRWQHFTIALFMAIAWGSMRLVQVSDLAITSLNVTRGVGLFFAGWLASMAMLLPGISGSLVLMSVGVYESAINALSTLNLPIIIVIGAGVAVGFVVSSKAITYVLKTFPQVTYAVILGLILGSVFVMYPGLPESGTPLVMSIIALITGLIVANILNEVGEMSRKVVK